MSASPAQPATHGRSVSSQLVEAPRQCLLVHALVLLLFLQPPACGSAGKCR